MTEVEYRVNTILGQMKRRRELPSTAKWVRITKPADSWILNVRWESCRRKGMFKMNFLEVGNI